MKHYVGLDVSQRCTSVCVVDKLGNRTWEGKCSTNPHAIAELLRTRHMTI